MNMKGLIPRVSVEFGEVSGGGGLVCKPVYICWKHLVIVLWYRVAL